MFKIIQLFTILILPVFIIQVVHGLDYQSVTQTPALSSSPSASSETLSAKDTSYFSFDNADTTYFPSVILPESIISKDSISLSDSTMEISPISENKSATKNDGNKIKSEPTGVNTPLKVDESLEEKNNYNKLETLEKTNEEIVNINSQYSDFIADYPGFDEIFVEENINSSPFIESQGSQDTDKIFQNNTNLNHQNLPNNYAESLDNLDKIDFIESEFNTGTGYDIGIDKLGDKERYAIVSFDDNWKNQYTNAFPILNEYGFKGTFNVICEDVGSNNRMDWQDLKNLQEQGHEIGSHSMSHKNLDLISTDMQEFEVSQSKQCIEENGLTVNGFSFPFNSGDDDPAVLKILSENYDYARTAGGSGKSLDDYQANDRYRVVGWSHDAERNKGDLTDYQMLEFFKKYVNEQIEENKIPIIIYHKVENSMEAYSTTPDLFQAEMDYLYENDFNVVTMKSIFG